MADAQPSVMIVAMNLTPLLFLQQQVQQQQAKVTAAEKKLSKSRRRWFGPVGSRPDECGKTVQPGGRRMREENPRRHGGIAWTTPGNEVFLRSWQWMKTCWSTWTWKSRPHLVGTYSEDGLPITTSTCSVNWQLHRSSGLAQLTSPYHPFSFLYLWHL